MNRAILQAIGTKLLQGGNCPHNPACIFGYGEHCSAEEDKLEVIIGKVMAQIRKERYCLPIRPNERGPWPCAEIITVKFDIPRPEHHEETDYSE